MPGILYVVATPIGNLEDITLRAIRVLREVDLIAAEDTRRTAKLLAHYEIRKKVVSLREHNELRQVPGILKRIAEGQSVALVTDAGTPGISDPGSKAVAAAHAAGLLVIPIPGPSAVAAALSASGFNADSFAFLGFVPRSGAAREAWLSSLQAEPRTAIFFESPFRIRRTLAELAICMAERPICVWREGTKVHETLGVQHNMLDGPPVVEERGEFTVILGPAGSTTEDPSIVVIGDVIGLLTNHAALGEDAALDMMALATGMPRNSLRRKLMRQHLSGTRP